MEKLQKFTPEEIKVVNNAVAMAEEVVSNFYKMSVNQWLRFKYDIKTEVDLCRSEIVDGPFAQVIRYVGQRKNTSLGSSTYDFYKICLQDHSILSTIKRSPGLKLFPFVLYIVTHELIHIIRFSRFLQSFDASPAEKIAEESRVHLKTHEILSTVRLSGMADVMEFYKKWRIPLDEFQNT